MDMFSLLRRAWLSLWPSVAPAVGGKDDDYFGMKDWVKDIEKVDKKAKQQAMKLEKAKMEFKRTQQSEEATSESKGSVALEKGKQDWTAWMKAKQKWTDAAKEGKEGKAAKWEYIEAAWKKAVRSKGVTAELDWKELNSAKMAALGGADTQSTVDRLVKAGLPEKLAREWAGQWTSKTPKKELKWEDIEALWKKAVRDQGVTAELDWKELHETKMAAIAGAEPQKTEERLVKAGLPEKLAREWSAQWSRKDPDFHV